MQIGYFFSRGLHRGLHRTRLAGPIRRKVRGYAALIDTSGTDPFRSFLESAPVDDEPVLAEEEAALSEVEADRAAGVPTIPFQEIKHRHGKA